jgi:hypothetical protein
MLGVLVYDIGLTNLISKSLRETKRFSLVATSQIVTIPFFEAQRLFFFERKRQKTCLFNILEEK